MLKPLNAANSLLVFALDAVKLQNLDMEKLDKLDRLILGQLQADGRATYDQIGEAVALSPSAVLRRVKRLESTGVIDRHMTLLKLEA